MLAAVLALTIHGLFLGFGPNLLSKTPPVKPKHLTVTFALRQQPEAGPGPELEHPMPSLEEVVRVLEKKAEKPVVKPEPQKEIPKPPEKVVLPKKKAVKKKKVKPAEKPARPKKKPKPPPKPVKAIIKPEKERPPDTVPRLASAAEVSPVLPLGEEAETVKSIPDLLPDISPDLIGNVVPEKGEKVASIPAAKKMIKARPAYRQNPNPEYPKIAKRRGYEGAVLLEVLVDSAGKVEDLRVLKSSGYRVLDRSAVKSVKNWLFEPGRIGDRKVEMWVRVPVRFELKN